MAGGKQHDIEAMQQRGDVDGLVALLGDPDLVVRGDAALSLTLIGGPAVPALVQALGS
ncbi:MAG: HEAT repeat domain-containing protein, partial [Methanobacteriota archaeon]